jgi:type III secretion protein W
MFDGEQGRMKVMDAVQEAVDQAVQREDEYLAQQEG